MITSLKWLDRDKTPIPLSERERIQRYKDNAAIFHSEAMRYNDLYASYTNRIQRVVGNFDAYVCFPVMFNYPRLNTLKTADLVCGEYPTITGSTPEQTDAIKDLRFDADFDSKIYATVIDISRYGDAVWRLYKDEETGKNTFTVWDPKMWIPIVSEDGTLTEKAHVLSWIENRGSDDLPNYFYVMQIHYPKYYELREYSMGSSKDYLRRLVKSEKVNTGFEGNAVIHINTIRTSDTVYGDDDYAIIDSITAELMTRVAQVSTILDKHADPALTGPVSMLKPDPRTGELRLERGKFYAYSPEEEPPKYLTWEGQLESAFKQIELLINQLYVLSEMGSALVGARDASLQASSGAAMRFKMVSPLAKARRIANAMTKPVQTLLAELSITIPAKNISIEWEDGLPDDPRENVELVKLATGEKAIMPLKTAIVEHFGRTNKEAERWMEDLGEQASAALLRQQEAMAGNKSTPNDGDPTHMSKNDSGGGKGAGHGGIDSSTNVNPNKKGAQLGLKNPPSPKNNSGKL